MTDGAQEGVADRRDKGKGSLCGCVLYARQTTWDDDKTPQGGLQSKHGDFIAFIQKVESH